MGLRLEWGSSSACVGFESSILIARVPLSERSGKLRSARIREACIYVPL